MQREDARELISPIMEMCKASILDSLNQLNSIDPKQRLPWGPRTLSNVLNDNAIESLKRSLRTTPGAQIREINGNQGILLHGKSAFIRVKKLDKKGFPMNVKTAQQKNMAKQGLFGTDEFDDMEILILGYKVNDTFSEIEKISLFPNKMAASGSKIWELGIYNKLDTQMHNLFYAEQEQPACMAYTGTDNIAAIMEHENETALPFTIRTSFDSNKQAGAA